MSSGVPRIVLPASAAAFAPASVGNVAVGFDILGHTIEGAGDRAIVHRIEERTVRMRAVRGVVTGLPMEAERNTAGAALLAMMCELGLEHGFEIELEKGIPLGSGMGGSAASCVAALVAANALLSAPVSRSVLYGFAKQGEYVASGGTQGDNVGCMLVGGLVLATERRLVPITVPPEWHCAVVHPAVVLETRLAREALRGSYELADFVRQSANLALVLSGCFRGDASLVREGLSDILIEPRRSPLIHGFAKVKAAAMENGAMGSSISGAGPSVFGWFETRQAAEIAAAAMCAAFLDSGLECKALVSRIAGPAATLEPAPPSDGYAPASL